LRARAPCVSIGERVAHRVRSQLALVATSLVLPAEAFILGLRSLHRAQQRAQPDAPSARRLALPLGGFNLSPIQTTAVAVRLFAIWLGIYWARWIPSLYVQARDTDDMSASVALIIATTLGFAFVLALWFFPRTIARGLLPGETTSPPIAFPLASWFAVGCTLLGLWVFTSAVPGLVQNGFLFFYAQRNDIALPRYWGGTVIYYLVELAVGVWLLLDAAGVQKVIWWARNARIGKAP
jgi:hypothetical protein